MYYNTTDLAQAARSAAAPESVNVVEPTTSVNQPVQPTVDTDNQSSAQGGAAASENVNVVEPPTVDTDNQSSAQVETIDDAVKRICTDGHSYVMTTVITNIDCQERTGRNGKSYLNAFVTILGESKVLTLIINIKYFEIIHLITLLIINTNRYENKQTIIVSCIHTDNASYHTIIEDRTN